MFKAFSSSPRYNRAEDRLRWVACRGDVMSRWPADAVGCVGQRAAARSETVCAEKLTTAPEKGETVDEVHTVGLAYVRSVTFLTVESPVMMAPTGGGRGSR